MFALAPSFRRVRKTLCRAVHIWSDTAFPYQVPGWLFSISHKSRLVALAATQQSLQFKLFHQSGYGLTDHLVCDSGVATCTRQISSTEAVKPALRALQQPMHSNIQRHAQCTLLGAPGSLPPARTIQMGTCSVRARWNTLRSRCTTPCCETSNLPKGSPTRMSVPCRGHSALGREAQGKAVHAAHRCAAEALTALYRTMSG